MDSFEHKPSRKHTFNRTPRDLLLGITPKGNLLRINERIPPVGYYRQVRDDLTSH